MPVIYCRTNADDDRGGYEWARVELPRGEAVRLLGYRPLLAAPTAHNDNFWGLEFFDYSADFGQTDDLDDCPAGEWVTPADRQPVFAPNRTQCSTVIFTHSGVMWTCQPKHAGGEVETAVLDWAVLERFAAGADDAFREVPAGSGDDSDDE